jgi:hypothetical protein
MKDWLAGFLAQRSEAVHATNVVYAIHLEFRFASPIPTPSIG